MNTIIKLEKYNQKMEIIYISDINNNYMNQIQTSFYDLYKNIKNIIYYKNFNDIKNFQDKNFIFINNINDINNIINDQNYFLISHLLDYNLTIDIIKIKKPLYGMTILNIENEKNLNFYDGELYYPIWGNLSNIDLQFMIFFNEKSSIKEYNYINLRKIFNMFNYKKRINKYNGINLSGYDDCYDCKAELYVLSMLSKKDINIEIFKLKKLSPVMLRNLNSYFTGKSCSTIYQNCFAWLHTRPEAKSHGRANYSIRQSCCTHIINACR